MARSRSESERALENALVALTKAVEKQSKASQQVRGGAARAPGTGMTGAGGPQPSTFAGGFAGAGGFASGLAGSKANITAKGIGGIAGQLAGRALGGFAGAVGRAALQTGREVGAAALDAVAKGQDVSAAASFRVDKLVADKLGPLGEAANRRVSTTEGVIADLNALTGSLDALGYDTGGIARSGAEIFKQQQERVYDARVRNVDIARQNVEDETIVGQIGRSLHELFGDAGLNGAK